MELPERVHRLEHTRTAEELIETIKAQQPVLGSPDEVLVQLYEDHAVELERYLVLRLRTTDAAEDLLHDTFLTAHQKLHEGEQVENGRAWLYRILKNKLMNHVAKNTRRRTDAEEDMAQFVDTDERHDHKTNDRMLFRKIMGELDPMFSEVLSLHDVQGLTTKEISEILDVSINTVSSRIRIARKKFKERYEELRQEGAQ